MSSFTRDLLQKFKALDDIDGDIELTLGLSLNGRFGVDPEAKRLKRSSSIPEFVMNPLKVEAAEEKTSVVQMGGYGPLVRTCSLPTEADDVVRRRKELQMLRRMEARRKRSEKQRNLKLARSNNNNSNNNNCEDDNKSNHTNNNGSNSSCQQGQCLKQLPTSRPPVAPTQPSSQGSVGSGSSVITELESQHNHGKNKHAEARSPASIPSLPDSEEKPAITCRKVPDQIAKFTGVSKETPPSYSNGSKSEKELIKNVLDNMPCVSTKGDGPNGKRIDGFLYQFRKGEEVMIVCVCHGSFLSPAEFVKHAGGTDVTHPLRHIVVNPSPFL